MADHVYHWKHGWIPLDHTAALSKAKGNHGLAAKYLIAAHSPDVGIRSRQDVAKAVLDLPNVNAKDRGKARAETRRAAATLNATDLLPGNRNVHGPADVKYAPVETLPSGSQRIQASRANGERVGMISWQPDGNISWVQVYEDKDQRKGIATEMLRRARKVNPKVHHSKDQSASAKAWTAGLRRKGIE